MAGNFVHGKPVILKNVRLQWGDIFEARGGEVNGQKTEPKFKSVGLFTRESEAATVAKQAMMAVATELWGANAENVVRNLPTNSKAVRDGNTKLDESGNVKPEFKDMLFISASNKDRPQIVAPRMFNGQYVVIGPDARGYVAGKDVTDEIGYKLTAPYRGCYVNLKVGFTAGKQDMSKNMPNQVYAKLIAVQFVRDGEAFGAGPTSAEGFGEEEVSQETVGSNSLF